MQFLRSNSPRRADYNEISSPSGNAMDDNSPNPANHKGWEANVDEMQKNHLLGGKTIGFFNSVVIVVNSIAGPGMLVLPLVYQEAGFVVPTLVLIFICISSSFCATFLVDAMARVPGNSRFQRRIEFVNVFEEFWGQGGMQLAQALFLINMLSQNVTSIVSNAQVMDAFIVFLNPEATTYALQISPTFEIISWSPPAEISNAHSYGTSEICHQAKVIPFDGMEGNPALISLGYVSLAVILVPMSIMNLEENVVIQKASFYMLCVFSAEFLVQFVFQGLDHHELPMFGNDYSKVLGSIVFNYAFINIIPSWLNEKRPDVSVNKTIWVSTISSTLLYIATGVLGALAYSRAHGNFLNMLSSSCSPTVTRMSAFLFAFGMIGLGIPFASIVMRYSLLVGRLCGPTMSSFWAIYFPWIISWVFYEGGWFRELVAWSGDLAIGPINFVLPLMVVLTALGVSGLVPRSWTQSTQHTELHQPLSSEGTGIRNAVAVAKTWDSEDLVNMETIVEPLPRDLKSYYRPIVTTLAVMLFLLIFGSIMSHSETSFDSWHWKEDFKQVSAYMQRFNVPTRKAGD